MHRAYSVLEIKSIDDEERVIAGLATTPRTDRAEDIVEPLGAEFALPMPLLWQHRADEPIGEVFFAKPTADGIPFKARIPKVSEPGRLKDRIDEAWQSIKAGLVRGTSVGFKPLEVAGIKGSFGVRFIRWAWLELSVVTIPANMDATIQTIKSFDLDPSAAPGTMAPSNPPGASGPVRLLPTRPGATTMDAREQIRAFEATRAAKVARMNDIQEAAANAGQTKDASQQEEFDTLRAELKSIDRELKDLAEMEAVNAASAKPVGKPDTLEQGAGVRGGTPIVRGLDNLPPGVRFARIVKVIGVAHRKHRDVEAVAEAMYPGDALIAKGAVAAGTVGNADWAGNLVGEETRAFADFVEFLRPQTIIGKFGANGIPSLRNVPFRTPLLGQSSGGAGYWVGEGKAKGLTKFDFTRTTLEPLKVANIAVLTNEVIEGSSPAADGLVRDGLAGALRERLDIDFIDPDKSDDSGVSPASITNTATGIPSSGNDAEAVRADLKALLEPFIADNNPPTNGVLVMSAMTALALSLMQNPLGQPEFPGISMAGGTLLGLPVIVSEYVATDSDGAIVVLVNASDIYLGDNGGIRIDVSREASLEMDTGPSHDSSGSSPAQLVSMFQTNSVAFLAERTISWKKRRESAVQYLSAVNWGAPTA